MLGIRNYGSVAIAEVLATGEIAIEAISITPESCELSGAWIISEGEEEALQRILANRLLIPIGDRSTTVAKLIKFLDQEVIIQDFIDEARVDAQSALGSFEEYVRQSDLEYAQYMSINPTDRKALPKIVKKKLVAPDFYQWPMQVDLNKSQDFLKSVGKLGGISGTPMGMKNVLTAARAIKLLVDMWHRDEIERSKRLYVVDQAAQIAILPNCWLSKLDS
jgi:hypothetical protein